MNEIGVVVIGRNEGERLIESLRSVENSAGRIVYVDSCSTDGSVENARALGVEVGELDMSKPFTAARARNVGVKRLQSIGLPPEFVHFVDGDCVIANGWFDIALRTIRKNKDVAIVYGRRKERFPEQTIYNRIVDMEWKNPAGFSDACGGDSLVRMQAFLDVGGFNPELIAGEEPEICFRLRRKGWKILCLNHDMTLHDADIRQFRQWWKRNVRCGYAYLEGFMMHGSSAEQYRKRQVKSVLAWTLCLPAISIGLIPVTSGLSTVMLGAYGLLWYRVCRWRLLMEDSPAHAALYATANTIGKFAELQGIMQCLGDRILRKRSMIIEYK